MFLARQGFSPQAGKPLGNSASQHRLPAATRSRAASPCGGAEAGSLSGFARGARLRQAAPLEQKASAIQPRRAFASGVGGRAPGCLVQRGRSVELPSAPGPGPRSRAPPLKPSGWHCRARRRRQSNTSALGGAVNIAFGSPAPMPWGAEGLAQGRVFAMRSARECEPNLYSAGPGPSAGRQSRAPTVGHAGCTLRAIAQIASGPCVGAGFVAAGARDHALNLQGACCRGLVGVVVLATLGARPWARP